MGLELALDRWRTSQRRNPFLAPEPTSHAFNRRRILMVSSTVARGGCERQILGTAAMLIERGYQVALLLFARPPVNESFEAEFRKLRIPLLFADECRLNLESEALNRLALSLPHDMFNFAASVHSTILDQRPHVVHAWSDYASVVAGGVAAALNVPRIVLGQRSVPPPHRQDERASIFLASYRALATNPRVVLVNNNALNATAYERWLTLSKGCIAVIPNALWPGTVRSVSVGESRQKRLRLGVPQNAKVVGSLMRFVEEKDPDLWLETALHLMRADNVKFVLAGYGELKERIAGKVVQMGLSQRFTFLDTVTDLAAFYPLLDVFLMTSRFEGTPNVLIEAQAAGCAIVATDVGGVREVVADGLTARIVKSRTAAEIAAEVLEILADNEWLSRARALGPQITEERFNPQRVLERTLHLYYPERSLFRKFLMQAKEFLFPGAAAHMKPMF